MKISDYQEQALRTESHLDGIENRIDPKKTFQLLNKIAFLCADLDDVKKQAFYGKTIKSKSRTKLRKKIKPPEGYIPGQNVSNLCNDPQMRRVFHAILGVATESAEMIEALIKFDQTGKVDIVNLAEEAGDVAWYLAVLTDTSKIPLETVLQKNIAKLKVRYPEKFTSEKAENRDLEAELQVLKGAGNE